MLLAVAISLAHSNPARGERGLLVIPVTSDSARTPSVKAALATVRAARSLQRARADYASSRFDRCIQRLKRTERSLRGMLPNESLAMARMLGLLKRVNQWLGLCHAVDGRQRAAAVAFVRATVLRGPAPDPSLFPPAVLKLYRAAESHQREQCAAVVPTDTKVWLDGRSVEQGTMIGIGEHYLVWQMADGAAGSDRVKVGQECQLLSPNLRRHDTDQVTALEARDSGFLQRVGKSAGVGRLLVVQLTEDALHLSVFDVQAGRFVERRESSVSRAGTLLFGGQPIQQPKPKPVQRTRWYKRWWVWALIGAGVAAAVTVPVMVSADDSYKLVF